MLKSILIFSCSFLFLVSCATHQSRTAEARAELLNGNCDSALKHFAELTVEEDNDQLLHLMEYGSALQICGDYQKSNLVFLQADRLSEQIDYHSVSRIIGATLLNEEMIQYKGDVFEKLFINASAALNYLELGQPDEAMVEVRRINEKYQKFAAEEKNSYELNSFAQYLSALIWESDGRHDDACIAYRKAFELDNSYRTVALDMLSACWRARRYQEYDALTKKVSPNAAEVEYIKRSNRQEVVVIYMQGLGPRKFERPGDHVFPYLSPTPNVTKKLLASFEDAKKEKSTRMSAPIYSVEKAAIATLEADYNALALRRVGARVAKEVLADQIRQKDKTLGNVAWLVMVLAEKADLRNWTLLPESLQILRLKPAPASKIELSGLNAYDARSEVFADIDLALNPRKKIYLVRGIK